jgi:hypothetical protein
MVSAMALGRRYFDPSGEYRTLQKLTLRAFD